MVLLVHGFPDNKTALYFEWCWQHPHEAKGLRDVVKTITNVGKRTLLRAKVRFLFTMLTMSPWNRLPLTVHWLSDKHHSNLEGCCGLPAHMTSVIGPFDLLDIYKNNQPLESEDSDSEYSGSEISQDQIIGSVLQYVSPQPQGSRTCAICSQSIPMAERVSCTEPSCKMKAHIHCLALSFLSNELDKLLPTKGECPVCEESLKWPDVIARKKRKEKAQAAANGEQPKQPEKTKPTRTPFLQLQQHLYVRQPGQAAVTGTKRKQPDENAPNLQNTTNTSAPKKKPKTSIQSLYC